MKPREHIEHWIVVAIVVAFIAPFLIMLWRRAL